MKKGISAIIATILLLLISVTLAGGAYMYASGMLTGRTAKTISISELYCTDNEITIVLSNDGTVDITNVDLKILVDNVDKTSIFSEVGGTTTYTINPHKTIVLIDNTTSYGLGTHTVLVTSPSNSARQTVYC